MHGTHLSVRILICGADGFIGGALTTHLRQLGHTVLRGVRRPKEAGDVSIDFTRDIDPQVWLPRLHGIDVVINAVGILRESSGQRYETIHHAAPVALFEACAAAGVRRVIQLSVLGIEQGRSGYFRSRLAAEQWLQHSALDYQIVRPSLVYGAHGRSSRLFLAIAACPLQILPRGMHAPLRPVHIDDLCALIACTINPAHPKRQTIPAVGRDEVSFAQLLQRYRHGMGMLPATQVSIPQRAFSAMTHLAGLLPGSLITPDSWQMLRDGNTADARQTEQVLGRQPRTIDHFTTPAQREDALAFWRTTLLRAALAVVWLGSALVSAGIYPINASLTLLQHVHLHGNAALLALFSGAALDALFGVLTLCRPGRRLWAAQFATVMVYSLIAAIGLPHLLAEPFAPLLKNLPILASLIVLYAEERRA